MPRRTFPKRKHRITWRHALIEVTAQRDYISEGSHHIELTVIEPEGAPIPVTETGYRSHFIPSALLEDYGGAVAFVTAWLNNEAKSKAWAKAEQKWRQLELELIPPAPPARTPKPKRARATETARQRPQ